MRVLIVEDQEKTGDFRRALFLRAFAPRQGARPRRRCTCGQLAMLSTEMR